MILIQIAGHLGQDPEVRFTPSGQKVTSIRVATNIRRGNKEKTIWWKVTMWGDRFDKKLSYLKKGSPVVAWGEMGIPDIYQDRDGNPQTSFEIIAEYIGFSPFGKNDKQKEGGQEGEDEADDSQMARPSPFKAKAQAGAPSAMSGSFAQDDDIPF